MFLEAMVHFFINNVQTAILSVKCHEQSLSCADSLQETGENDRPEPSVKEWQAKRNGQQPAGEGKGR